MIQSLLPLNNFFTGGIEFLRINLTNKINYFFRKIYGLFFAEFSDRSNVAWVLNLFGAAAAKYELVPWEASPVWTKVAKRRLMVY